ncbi:LuxR C-terminal-related transcriptional regulator [Streptomyces sp. NPDC087422]|uniref:helix-turn-helix transcriptional regulator n=1 Tax=Streptomyces sp. NPDC087422 TaxID=3365786 RepID=UPI003817965B
MPSHDGIRPQDALARALVVTRAPLPDTMRRLSEVLTDLVPHRAVARRSAVCTFTPTAAFGDEELTGRITGAELTRLAGRVTAGAPWQGEAVLAGAPHPVLAVASAREFAEPAEATEAADTGAGAGPLLVVVRSSAEPLDADVTAVAQGLWDLVTVNQERRMAEAGPTQAASSRAAAAARARAIAKLTDAHSSVLSAILGTLRAASLDDTAARRGAVDLAVAALIDLRAGADLDRELSEEPADAAFGRLTAELRPLLRYSPVELDLRPPASRRTLAADVAHGARAAVRGAVLAMLEQGDLGRLHVSWQLDEDTLRVLVRDDGPGLLAPEALAVHRFTDRLTALGGRLVLDALPGWGSTFTVTLPLSPDLPAAPAAAGPLDALHPRERQVLEELALGRRNREIALALHISESTVKFHVANILAKLGVASRGEAAALARTAAATA